MLSAPPRDVSAKQLMKAESEMERTRSVCEGLLVRCNAPPDAEVQLVNVQFVMLHRDKYISYTAPPLVLAVAEEKVEETTVREEL